LLEALAWWAAMGHQEPTRTQLAAKAGWTPKGSNLRNRLSELSQLSLVEYPRAGTVRLTPAGAAAAPEPTPARR
jgi:Mn-dependent DtxR family transcriptional regulator